MIIEFTINKETFEFEINEELYKKIKKFSDENNLTIEEFMAKFIIHEFTKDID